MKNKPIKLGLLAAALAGSAALVQAQTISTVTWSFGDDDTIYDAGSLSQSAVSGIVIGNSLGTVADPVNTTSSSSGYTGATGGGNLGNAFRTGVLNTGSGGSGFLEFTITPEAGVVVTLTSFNFAARSTSTGAQAFELRTSANDYGSSLFSGSVAVGNNSQWSVSNTTIVSSSMATFSSMTTFRLYGFNGTGSPTNNGINTRFDDITLSVSASAIPEPSTYAAIFGGAALAGAAVVRRRRALLAPDAA